jgi:hypothetical protein
MAGDGDGDGTESLRTRAEAEVARLRALLKAEVSHRRSLRGLEEELGLEGGGVRKVLNGQANLTLAHVLLFLDAAGASPAGFFREAYPEGEPVAAGEAEPAPPPRPGSGKAEGAGPALPLRLTEEDLAMALGRLLLRALRDGRAFPEA